MIVSLAWAAGATRAMLATSALATRIPLIFRIFLLVSVDLALRYLDSISGGLIACVYLLNGRQIEGEQLVSQSDR